MSNNPIPCKVVLVGETGTGKTCIIKSFIDNKFNLNEHSSLNITYYNKVLIFQNNKSIAFDIWDTIGQEKYRSLTKNFYQNASIGIIVYDITNQKSFQAIKDYWYQELKTSGEDNIVIAVVGNKIDKFCEEQVKENEGKEYADSIGAIFKLTSCLQKKGINELFVECGEKYLGIEKDTKVEPEKSPSISLTKETHNEIPVKKKKKKC